MLKNKFDAKETFEKYLWYLPNWLGAKNPKLAKVVIVLLVIFSLTGLSAVSIFLNSKKTEGVTTDMGTQVPILGDSDENKISEVVINEKIKTKCEGAQFDIVTQLSPVGGERFSFPYPNDDHIASVSGSKNYQGSYKTIWGCQIPFIVRVTAIPISGQSLGLFLEIENILKIIVGDGDKKYVKLQQNKSGIRDDWNEVFRRKLSNEIVNNKEVSLRVFIKRNARNLKVRMEIYYSGNSAPDWFEAEIEPGAANLFSQKEIGFRVGINDWLYKGAGTNVRLENFSILQKDW